MNVSEIFGQIPSEFILTGLSWVSEQKLTAWCSLLFLLMYIVVILGNCGIIILVRADRKLHEPMHVLTSLLAMLDLTVASSVIPKVLAILWYGSNTVSAGACLTQMYILYTMFGFESSLFALMSLDRYVAICHPLRHNTVMSNSFIIKLILFTVVRNSTLLVPMPILTKALTFCKNNLIAHSYCEFVEVIKLSCGDLTPLVIYMVSLIFLIPASDNAIIIFSYIMILKVVHSLKSSEAQWKALNTCSSHAIMLSMFYFSACIPLVIFLYFPDSPLPLKTLPEVLSCLLIPVINPIVYGVRTKEIQEGFKRLYWKVLAF
ncbi:olfactory receptor 52M1-like [Pelobates cultripes]|uniref:Olfactory receptor 52M1-like n=1 Tax=Pelobates cultripes TaxID=61616 RepID=A0AAD1R9F6_PELCU|nr:olfactory receptor 52M1-like [Pelobates cultripes]